MAENSVSAWLSDRPAGSASAARRAAATSESTARGARILSRNESQSPYTQSKSLRLSAERPVASIAVCRSERPLVSSPAPWSGSCHGRGSASAPTLARPVSGSARWSTCARSRGSSQGSPAWTYSG